MSYPWIVEARKYIGEKEIPGNRHNPLILRWWKQIGQIFTTDEVPWCAAFVGGCLEAVEIASTRRANARSYLNWGDVLDRPSFGCVVVFWRGRRDGWSGHVGFVMGRTPDNHLLVLGGNQADQVNIKEFTRDRVLGYRWPKDWPLPDKPYLRVIAHGGGLSINES